MEFASPADNTQSSIGLQAFLAEEKHQEVNKEGRDDLQEEDDEDMQQSVGADGDIRVPEATVEGVLVQQVVASVQNLPPGYRLHLATR